MAHLIAIDGPAGAGKSTVAKLVSARVGFPVLDTGSMYRAVAWEVLRQGADMTDDAVCSTIVAGMKIEILGPGLIAVNGQDISDQIRNPEISAAASVVAALPTVHRQLQVLQRRYASDHDCVVEGRDIGTEVFPKAIVKIFLTASEGIRFDRVFQAYGESAAQQIAERDRREATRRVAPMIPAQDAVVLDSSHRSVEEVVDFIVALFQERVVSQESR